MAKKKPSKKSAKKPAPAARWSRSARTTEALDASVALEAEWYRLVPVGAREIADTLTSEGRPQIDRKLAPPYALIDVGDPRAFLCSRAFAEGLGRAGARGWSLAEVDHLTGEPVEGYPIAWLELDRIAGRIASTIAPNGTPLAPVTLDLSTGTGHELAWTAEWVGVGPGAWRALIASRRVVAALFVALAEVGDERWFALEPLETSGGRDATNEQDELPSFPTAARPLEKSVATSLSELADRADRDGHDLGARSEGEVGRWPDSDLEACLTEHEGLRLHRGALELFTTRGRPSLAQATDAAKRQGADPRDGERVFAVSPGLGVFWAVTPEGKVRGLAQSGLRYGPGAPFADWLRDLVADLSAAAAQPERPWAVSLLSQ